MLDVALTFRQIYAGLWNAAAPSSPSDKEPAGDELRFERRVLEFPTAAVARLGEDFLEAQLIDAGVAVRDGEGELIPAPPLGGERIEFVALRTGPGELPFELLTSTGCLRSAAATAMLRDYRLRARLARERGYLYVAMAWPDAIWLERVGLAVIYCPGVEALNVPLLRDLAAELAMLVDPSAPSSSGSALGSASASGNASAPGAADGVGDARAAEVEGDVDVHSTRDSSSEDGANRSTESRRAVDEQADPDDDENFGEPLELDYAAGDWLAECAAMGPALVVVAWSPGAWLPGAWRSDAAAPLEAQLERLARAQRIIPLDMPEVIIWSPRAEDLEELDLLARWSDGPQLREAIRDSVQTAGLRLSAAAAVAPEESYSAARAAYLSAQECGADEIELSTLRTRFDRCRRRDLIDPVLQHAERENNPLQRALYVSVAETCDLLLQMAPSAAAACRESSARGSFLERGDRGAAAVRQYVALAKTLASFTNRRA